jgi:hypothetical protein
MRAARDPDAGPALDTIELGDELEEAIRRGRDVAPQIDDLGFEANARCAGGKAGFGTWDRRRGI